MGTLLLEGPSGARFLARYPCTGISALRGEEHPLVQENASSENASDLTPAFSRFRKKVQAGFCLRFLGEENVGSDRILGFSRIKKNMPGTLF